ncbi:hypothetical protein VNO77_27401 [Canavalia gladiata]|uniref:Uncharacterized protein n=1 Tax=Canavalia gladiata TaxID=3824 RepID=A0AAN9Q721_CANGL
MCGSGCTDMASLRLSHATPQNRLTIGFPSTPRKFSFEAVRFTHTSRASSSILSCKGFRRLQANQRLLTAFASNPNSAVEKSPNEGSNVNETSNVAEGPPLLTILAGVFVFFLFCWIIGSIIMWLISLIVNVPRAK